MSALETAADRAEEMLPVAAHLAMLVHGDGGPQDVKAVLDSLDDAQKVALIVVLAGLVDPDQPIGEALAWLEPSAGDGEALRMLAADPDPGADPDLIDMVAVEEYLAGRQVEVTPQERLEAVVRWVRRGGSYLELDAHRRMTAGTTSTFVSRTRKRYTTAGRPFPVMEHATGVPVFSAEQVRDIRERAERGATDLETAMAYGVHSKTIMEIVLGRSYRDAGGPLRGVSVRGVPAGAEVKSRGAWALQGLESVAG